VGWGVSVYLYDFGGVGGFGCGVIGVGRKEGNIPFLSANSSQYQVKRVKPHSAYSV